MLPAPQLGTRWVEGLYLLLPVVHAPDRLPFSATLSYVVERPLEPTVHSSRETINLSVRPVKRAISAASTDQPLSAYIDDSDERGRTPSRAETPGKHRDSPAPSVSVRGRETSAAIPEHVFSDSQIGETESQIEVRLEAESR